MNQSTQNNLSEEYENNVENPEIYWEKVENGWLEPITVYQIFAAGSAYRTKKIQNGGWIRWHTLKSSQKIIKFRQKKAYMRRETNENEVNEG